MNAEHTPSPWVRRTPGTIVGANDRPVATISKRDATAGADARLIAAAPDLLAALRAFNDAYSFISEDAPAPLAHAVRKARAAIAKATG